MSARTAKVAREYLKKNRDRINSKRRERYHRKHPEAFYRLKYRDDEIQQLANTFGSKEASNYLRRQLIKADRDRFIEMYGGKCACCGEEERDFLALDHVGGQVGKKREHSYDAVRRALLEYRPDTYRILCHNCNMATRYNKICPHKRSKHENQQ